VILLEKMGMRDMATQEGNDEIDDLAVTEIFREST